MQVLGWVMFMLSSIYKESFARGCSKTPKSSPAVLYVWSGQATTVKNAADFVAVIDFDEKSCTYGKILKTVPLVSNASEGIAQAGNEPHHSGISSDGKYYITGGLLSFLSKSKEVFVWKIPSNPARGPRFLYALDVPGACTDEFLPIGDAKFLVSMMCNTNATSPGDMAFIDASTKFTKSFLKDAGSLKDFNPHGFDRLKNGSILTADYIDPITLTGTDPSKIVFRDTVRHFYPDGTLKRTINIPYLTDPHSNSGVGYGDGFMELKCIPHDPFGRCYACSTSLNLMYLVGPGMPESIVAFDASIVNSYNKRISAGITTIFPDGKKLLMTFQMRYVILLDIIDPVHPKLLRVFDFCTDSALKDVKIKIPESDQKTTFPEFCAQNNNISGAHVLVYPKGERRFIVMSYFLKFGLAQFAGTRTVHAFKFNKDLTYFTYDDRFNPNIDFAEPHKQKWPTFHSLKAFPHHVQYLKL